MQSRNQPETLDGPTVTTMAELAQKHRTYIVCPIDRRAADNQAGACRVNSSVLIDRLGRIVCVYDKIYPYWSEYDLTPVVQPGQSGPPVYQADFARIGMAVCFDVNFPSVWQALADQDAELVICPAPIRRARRCKRTRSITIMPLSLLPTRRIASSTISTARKSCTKKVTTSISAG